MYRKEGKRFPSPNLHKKFIGSNLARDHLICWGIPFSRFSVNSCAKIYVVGLALPSTSTSSLCNLCCPISLFCFMSLILTSSFAPIITRGLCHLNINIIILVHWLKGPNLSFFGGKSCLISLSLAIHLLSRIVFCLKVEIALKRKTFFPSSKLSSQGEKTWSCLSIDSWRHLNPLSIWTCPDRQLRQLLDKCTLSHLWYSPRGSCK